MTDTHLYPQPRPAFDGWLRLVRRDYTWAAEQLGVSSEYVRLICLPFSDPKRRPPGGGLIERVVRLTSGAVTGDGWHPPVAEMLRERAA